MGRTATQVPVIMDDSHRRALLECRDLSLVYFTAQLGDMYSNVHDIIWDFADKAETNELQRRFIDAVTVVTARRTDLEFVFRELITKGFSDFAAGRPIAKMFKNVPQEYSENSEMELLSKSAIEEYVAIQNIANKTKSDCYQQLYALGQRLSLMRGGVKVNDFDIPAGSLHALYSFSKAVESFSLVMDINLVLFFIFEKYVMKDIGGLYDRYNDCLINAGIFPNLKYVAQKAPSSKLDNKHAGDEGTDNCVPGGIEEASQSVRGMRDQVNSGSGVQATAVSVQSTLVGEEIFDSICGLLTMRRKNDPRYDQHPELNPNAPSVVMATKPALIAVIDAIQDAVSNSYTPMYPPAEYEGKSSIVNTAVLEQIQNKPHEEQNKLFDGVERRRIPFADLDMIEFVGMLFEYVLNDEELPNVVKALISHLHTPFLKVAVLDPGLLIDGQHVAHRLLDLMLEAGHDWVDESQLLHGAFYPMERQVERILHEFKEDIALFDEILEDFQKDIDILKQKALSNEERSREAERGHDKLEAARKRAKHVISRHVGERELPSSMHSFLFQVWMDRMTLLLVRKPNAEETKSWKKSLTIVDALLWSLDAPKDQVKQQRLREIYPALKRRIENMLDSVSDYYLPEAQALFDLLLAYQSDGSQEQGEDVQPEAVMPEGVDEIELEGLVANVEILADTSAVEDAEIELTLDEELIAKRLRISEFGTLFEFDNTAGEPIRAKLSWFSPLTKRYMFVDRNGVQVTVRPLKTLVRELSNGTAHIIEPVESSFLEQALQSIKDMLENAAGKIKTVTAG